VTRVIALEEGLDYIGEFLRSKGYRIVDWNEQNAAVDAVVYTGKKLESINAQAYSPMTSALTEDLSDDRSFGVLLVNAQGKSAEEIYQIINHRVYEHIF